MFTVMSWIAERWRAWAILAIVAVLAAGLRPAVQWYLRKQRIHGSPRNGFVEMRYPFVWRAVRTVFGIPFIAFFFMLRGLSGPKLALGLTLSSILFGTWLWGLARTWLTRIVFNAGAIEDRTRKRTRRVVFEHVTRVDFRVAPGDIVICDSGGSVSIPLQLDGFAEFARLALSRLPSGAVTEAARRCLEAHQASNGPG